MTHPLAPVLTDPVSTDALAATYDLLADELFAIPGALPVADQHALWAGVVDFGRWITEQAGARRDAVARDLEIGETR